MVHTISQKVDIYEKKISELEEKVNEHEEKIAKLEQRADDCEECIGKVDRYISKLIPWTHEVSKSIAFQIGGSAFEDE